MENHGPHTACEDTSVDNLSTHLSNCDLDPSVTRETENVLDPSITNGTNGDLEYSLTIETLPLEILMDICSYLDARFVLETLSRVSERFRDVITVDSYWKNRIAKRWPKQYPAVHIDACEIDWTEACIAREEQYRIWHNHETNIQHFVYNYGVYASVDAVHLMQCGSLVATGSRDRYLNIVDVSTILDDKESMKRAKLHSVMNAHTGWIWDVKSQENIVYTASWDRDIKLWDLAAGCTESMKFRLKSAVLSLYVEPGFIAAGCYDKILYQIDPRMGDISEKRLHKQPVLAVCADDKVIITASEDSTIVMYDRRKRDVINTIKLPSYAMCMSYGQNQLWVGDKAGAVHLIDCYQQRFSLVETYDVGHTRKITGIQHTLGALYTCSTDKTIRILEPNRHPGTIGVLHDQGEIAGLHMQNDVIATAGSGFSIGIWKPKLDTPPESDTPSDSSPPGHDSQPQPGASQINQPSP